MRIWVGILLLIAVGVAVATPAQADLGQPTAFALLDTKSADKAYIGNLKRAKSSFEFGVLIKPYNHAHKPISKSNYAYKTTTSDKNLKKVSIGCHQVTLKQQFRVNLATTPNSGLLTAEVSHSLRGGWSAMLSGQIAYLTRYMTNCRRKESFQC